MNREIYLNINNSKLRVELNQGRERARVAGLGPAGTYTEAARHNMLGNYLQNMDAVFLDRNQDVVQAVEAGDFDLGVVAVENSIEGDVVEVLRELHHAKNVKILGESILGIQHMLIGYPDESIQEIHSHPQALGQSRSFLLERYRDIPQIPANSTAAAVEMIKNNRRIAAIASRRAAEINGLPILAQDIGDVKGNSTRFLILGRGETEPTGNDSTTILFEPRENKAGILARCLITLASYGVDLTKLDSRPTGFMRRYMFLMTMNGHQIDNNVRDAINDLKDTYCDWLRVLGSYRTADIPEGVKDPGSINGQ